MANGLSMVTAGQTSGSLSSVGASLSHLGATIKAFVITHPTTTGFVMGVSTVYLFNRMLQQRRSKKARALQAV